MISAIVLAAGESKRMGESKMVLPWGKSTVLQTVIATCQAAGVSDVLVVTGGEREKIEALIGISVQTVFNTDYANGEMLSSIQLGLQAKLRESSAALICLGDQPQLQTRTVQSICEAFRNGRGQIIVPSFQMRRGHPWLVGRPLWDDLLKLRSPKSPRDFLNAHSRELFHLNVETPSVIEDLDTPEDYLKYKPAV